MTKLNQLYSRKYYSFAGQILEAEPYVPDDLRAAIELIREIRQIEENQAEELAGLITALDGVPEPLLPEANFIEINYLSLDFLLPQLLRHQETTIAACRQLLAQCHSQPKIEQLLHQIIDRDEQLVVKLSRYLPSPKK